MKKQETHAPTMMKIRMPRPPCPVLVQGMVILSPGYL